MKRIYNLFSQLLLFIAIGFLFSTNAYSEPRRVTVAAYSTSSIPGGKILFSPEGLPDTACVQDSPSVRKFCRIFQLGDTLRLTAVPDSNFLFSQWTAGSSSHDLTITIVVNENKFLAAKFLPRPFDVPRSLIVAAMSNISIPGGRVFFQPEGKNDTNCVQEHPEIKKYCKLFHNGDTVHLLAVPDSGFRFVEWGGTSTSHDAGIFIVMNENKLAQAHFAQLSPNPGPQLLKVIATTPNNVIPGGRVLFQPDGLPDSNCREINTGVRKYCRLYHIEDTVHLLAVPDSGFFFAGWSEGIVANTRELTVIMHDTIILKALFTPNAQDTIKRLTVIASSGTNVPGGRVFFSPEGRPDTACHELNSSVRKYCRLFIKNDSVRLHAEPDAGFYFAGWLSDSLFEESYLSLRVTHDISLRAVFVATAPETTHFAVLRIAFLRYAGKVLANPEGFSLDCPDLPETKVRCLMYREGAVVNLLARPNDGFFFTGWSLEDSSRQDTVLSIVVRDTINVYANFIQDTTSIPLAEKFRTFSQRQLSVLRIKTRKDAPPDTSDIRDSVFNREFGRSIMTLGIAQTNKDSIKKFGWITFKKAKNVALFFPQTGTSYFFDSLRYSGRKAKPFVKALSNPMPKDYNNHLAGELAALKINIASSRFGTTRKEFGNLMYTDENSQFNGYSIKQIRNFADSAMTYWKRFQNIVRVDSLDSVVTRLNRSFLAQIDSTDILFRRPLVVEGRIELDDVPFLQIGDSIDGKFSEVEGEILVSRLPENPSLAQNYPNPFNPTTIIRYSLLENSRVTLKIYNVLGEEVASLLNNEEIEIGEHEILFDASNLSSGIYYYRLITQSFTETRKMLLVK